MTPAQIREFLRRCEGKRVTLENDRTLLSGVVHGVDDQGRLLVAQFREVAKTGRPTGFVPKGDVDVWGLPAHDVAPRRIGGKTVFVWGSRERGWSLKLAVTT